MQLIVICKTTSHHIKIQLEYVKLQKWNFFWKKRKWYKIDLVNELLNKSNVLTFNIKSFFPIWSQYYHSCLFLDRLKIMKEFFIFQSKEITSAIVWLFNTIAAIKDLSLPCAQLSDTVLVHLKNQYELRCIQMSNWREKLSENTKCLIEYFPVVCMNNKGHIFGTSFIRNDSNIQRMRV